MERRFSDQAPSDFFEKRLGPTLDLSELGLVLVRPDAYQANRGLEILEAVQATGLSLVGARCLLLEPWHFELLYHEKTKLFTPNVWLFEQIYGDTPCLALVFRRNGRTRKDHGSVPEALNRLKGNSSPSGGPSVGLRERMGRASSFHGVLHCSDSVESLRNDLLTLFEKEELVRTLSSPELVGEACGGPMLRFYLENDEQRANRLDVVQFFVHAMRKILSAVLVRHRHFFGCEDRERIRTLFDEYSALSMELEEDRKFSERVALFTRFQQTRRALVLQVSRIAPSPPDEPGTNLVDQFESQLSRVDAAGLLSLLGVLGAYHGFTGLSLAKVGSVLQRGGVFLTKWQTGLLWAGITTDLNADSEWDGKSVYDRARILGKETP